MASARTRREPARRDRRALDARFGNGGWNMTPLLPLRNRNRATVTALLQDRSGRPIALLSGGPIMRQFDRSSAVGVQKKFERALLLVQCWSDGSRGLKTLAIRVEPSLVPVRRPAVERVNIDDMNSATPRLDQFGAFQRLECPLHDFPDRAHHGGYVILRVGVFEIRGLLHEDLGAPCAVDEQSSHPRDNRT